MPGFKAPAAAPGHLTKPCALVIDDRADIRYLMAKLLRALDHEVYEAGDGKTALYLARAYRPDVVLVDILLPDMGGYELARLLRRELGRSARIAAMTAFADFDPSKSYDAGFDQHFSSPVEPAVLQSWLGRHPTNP